MSKAILDKITPDLNKAPVHAKNICGAQNAYVAHCSEHPKHYNDGIVLKAAAAEASEQTIQYLCSVLECHGLGKAFKLAGEIQTYISNKGSNDICWYSDFRHFASEGAYYPNAYRFIDVLDQFQKGQHIILSRGPRLQESAAEHAKMLRKKDYLDRIVRATCGFLACPDSQKEDKQEAATALLSLMRTSSGAQSPWLYELALAFKANPDLMHNGQPENASYLHLMFKRVAQEEAQNISAASAFHPISSRKDMAFLIEAMQHFCEHQPNGDSESSLITNVFGSLSKIPEAKEEAAGLCDALEQSSGSSRDFIGAARKALGATAQCSLA